MVRPVTLSGTIRIQRSRVPGAHGWTGSEASDIDLGGVGHLVQRSADEHAPAGFGDVIGVVRLERHP